MTALPTRRRRPPYGKPGAAATLRGGGPGEETLLPRLAGLLARPGYRGAGGAPMSSCQDGAPAAKRGRTTLTACRDWAAETT